MMLQSLCITYCIDGRMAYLMRQPQMGLISSLIVAPRRGARDYDGKVDEVKQKFFGA